MKKFWEQLKPQERQAVAVVGVIFFLVLNYFLVWPKFKEWGANQKRRQTAESNIITYQAELAHKADYEKRIAKFGSESVPVDEQDTHFQNFILDRAQENGVERQNESSVKKSTTEYFLEKQVNIQVVAPEPGLVNFLYSLGSGGSMVRVRNLILHPSDLARFKLHADVVIVASYQKAAPSPSARTAAAIPPVAPAPSTPPPMARQAAPASKPLPLTNKTGTPNIKRP